MLVIILLFGAGILFYYYMARQKLYWKNKGVTQTNSHWFYGDTRDLILMQRNGAYISLDLYNKYPNERYVGYYQFNVPILMIRDPELVKEIAIKSFDHFIDHKNIIPPKGDLYWSNNLLVLKGQKWKYMRSILRPAFTSNKMRIIYNLMAENADDLVKYYLEQKKDSIDLSFKDLAARYANDMIATTAFGVKVDSLKNPDNEFYTMAKKLTNVITLWKNLRIGGSLIYKDLYKYIEVKMLYDPGLSFFVDLLKNTIKARREGNIIRPDMLHLLLVAQKEANDSIDKELNTDNAGNQLRVNELDIMAQAFIFFFAGFDSVYCLVTFMAYELAINKDIQDRLREEIRQAYASCNGTLTYEALFEMKYLDMVISETLRKWPNFATMDRICTEDHEITAKLPGEKTVTIEKGTEIAFPIYALHHDPKYYPDPEKFNPERFSAENKSKTESVIYMPFGLGPRACIGNRFAILEAKILFSYLLMKFEILPNEKTVIPIKLSPSRFNVNPADEVNLTFKLISN